MLINFSGVIILGYIGFEITLIVFSIGSVKVGKAEQTSKLATFVKGLNLKQRMFSIIYFLHFIGFRLLLGFLILLTPVIKSYLLWTFILSVQIICLVAHLFKLYEKCICYILTLLREIWLLFIVLYIFSLQFKDQSSDSQKLKHLIPFLFVNISFTAIFTLINLANMLLMLILSIHLYCLKR